ncbi:MAG TPA: hypothetical protein VFU36_08125, partial [Jatrophihabitans sp.]|nr:hypothetical protein [Jatrophihabitans sp.]
MYRTFRVSTAVLAGVAVLSLASVNAQAYAAPVARHPVAKRPAASAAAAGSDLALSGWGDQGGYHLDVGQGGRGFGWREVAVLKPAGLDTASWTGYQCLSGDGRYAAVAVLPTSVVNLESARDRGAFAYSVQLSTGAARPIASGVALKYFSPGCGVADQAAFTIDLGSNDASTEVIRADLATGSVLASVTVPGQVTSAVTAATGLVGAMGSHLVRLPDSGSGNPTLLSATPGDVYDLHPSADGGLSFLAARPGSTTATALHEHAGKLTQLASGPLTRLALFGGRAGRTVLSGSVTSDPAANAAAGDRVVNDSGLPHGARSSSLDGTMLIGDPSGKQTDPLVLVPGSGHAVSTHRPASSRASIVAVSRYYPPGVLTQPADPRPTVKLQPGGDTAYRTTTKPDPTPKTQKSPTAPMATSQSPTCAIPRLSPSLQVMQPSPAQVNWAVQLAEQGLLTSSNGYSRPANFANMGLVSYAPSSDFAPIPLSHPSGSSTTHVPRSVYEAIMAQESNWSQASWHAPKGMAGDPLIADYYGAGGDIVSIDYADADCGYGIGQVTDGMRSGDTMFSLHGQMKIAVDYQENIAAGLQILEQTWN